MSLFSQMHTFVFLNVWFMCNSRAKTHFLILAVLLEYLVFHYLINEKTQVLVSFKLGEKRIHWLWQELIVPYILVFQGTSSLFLIPAEQTYELWCWSWNEGLCIHCTLSRTLPGICVFAPNSWLCCTCFMEKWKLWKYGAGCKSHWEVRSAVPKPDRRCQCLTTV